MDSSDEQDQKPAWEKKIDEYKFCCKGDYCFGHEDDKEYVKQIIRHVEAQARQEVLLAWEMAIHYATKEDSTIINRTIMENHIREVYLKL